MAPPDKLMFLHLRVLTLNKKFLFISVLVIFQFLVWYYAGELVQLLILECGVGARKQSCTGSLLGRCDT